jgi:predicted GNAT superfamily acetyltransferase
MQVASVRTFSSRRRPDEPVEIVPAGEADFVACERLMRRVYDFTEAQALPAWQMFAATLAGGVTIVARTDRRVVGCVHGFPSFARREPTLYTVALVVEDSLRGRGLGRGLMEAHRERARELGYASLQWTVDSVAISLLHLYLNRLGAHIDACHAGMYDVVRPEPRLLVPRDEFGIVWPVDARASDHPPADIAVVTETRELRPGVRAFDGVDEERLSDPCAIELPWSETALLDGDRRSAYEWRLGVRQASGLLIDRGLRGREVELDRERRRAFVVFSSMAS